MAPDLFREQLPEWYIVKKDRLNIPRLGKGKVELVSGGIIVVIMASYRDGIDLENAGNNRRRKNESCVYHQELDQRSSYYW